MQRNVRTRWLVVGAVLTVLAVLAVPVAGWADLVHMHGSGYASAPLPGYRETHIVERAVTLTSPQIVVTADGPVDITIVVGPTGQLTIKRELTWVEGQPDFRESWDGQHLDISLGCGRVEQRPASGCRGGYTLSVAPQIRVTATSDSGTVADRRPT
jgi:hypothetical protein